MIYAVDEGVYEHAHQDLKELCTRLRFSRFYDYFDKNWNSCKDMWVKYCRANLPHLKNHTNNRLESYFGKFKLVPQATPQCASV